MINPLYQPVPVSPSEKRKNNEIFVMTRRYPDLPKKVLYRDSEIIKKIIHAWDIENSQEMVLAIFLKENKNLSDERYWEIMRSVWIICGSIQNTPIFRKLMSSSRKHKYYFSSPEEAKKLRDMPDVIDVYRATNDINDGGIAWTISEQYAQYYKDIFGKNDIINRHIDKKDVFAFIERNNESEIILL